MLATEFASALATYGPHKLIPSSLAALPRRAMLVGENLDSTEANPQEWYCVGDDPSTGSESYQSALPVAVRAAGMVDVVDCELLKLDTPVPG
jgi:hypothetical protein